MPTKKKPVISALVSALGAAKWTDVQVKSIVKNLRMLATTLNRAGLGCVKSRARFNFGGVRVEIMHGSHLASVVNFLRRNADDLEKKSYRAKLITRFRSRLYR